MSLGETVENTLKGGGAEQRGGDKKILKRGVSWVRGGGGRWNLLIKLCILPWNISQMIMKTVSISIRIAISLCNKTGQSVVNLMENQWK